MNFFDFLLKAISGTELGILVNLGKILAKSDKGVRGALNNAAKGFLKKPNTIKEFIREMIKDPRSLAKGLSKLTPKELAELNVAIDKARDSTEKIKKGKNGTFTESKALSSSWLIHGEYKGNEKQGTITITTIQGKSYNFPAPISYAVWTKMKMARGRNGTGAGSIFHKDYWSKLRNKTIAKIQKGIIFKLAGIAKKVAK